MTFANENNGRHLLAAALTPLTTDGHCDPDRLAAHCRDLLGRGCEGVLLFGTSGEGASFSVSEKLAALGKVIEAGVSPDRLLLGLLGSAVPDLVTLARGAHEARCAGVLMLPPFFFRDVSQDGLFESFRNVIEQSPVGLRFYLYNFSAMCGSELSPDLIARLCTSFPDVIAGIKDSAGNWAYTATILERFPALEIYLGHEPHIAKALALGARGAICGMANVIPERLLDLWDSAPGLTPRIQGVADFYDSVPFIPATKAALAALRGDPEWRHVRAPLSIQTGDVVASLAEAYRRVGDDP